MHTCVHGYCVCVEIDNKKTPIECISHCYHGNRWFCFPVLRFCCEKLLKLVNVHQIVAIEIQPYMRANISHAHIHTIY